MSEEEPDAPDSSAPPAPVGDESAEPVDRPFLFFNVAGRTMLSLTRPQYEALSPFVRRVVDLWGVQQKTD